MTPVALAIKIRRHSFFVHAGESTALVHNTNPGLRTYMVYVVDLPDGAKYVGRASIAYTRGTSQDKAFDDCIKRRFKRHHRVVKHPGFSINNVRIVWKDIYMTGVTRDKVKIYETMRGIEHLEIEKYEREGTSANRSIKGGQKGISDRNPRKSRMINRALDFAPTICK